MRLRVTFSLLVLLTGPLAHAGEGPTVNDKLVDRIINREHAVTEDLKRFHPLVETYVQKLARRHGRLVPKRDRYYLSLADFSGQLRALRFKSPGLEFLRSADEALDSTPNSLSFDPSGFVAMAYPDPFTFDIQHYSFRYLNEEFLGEVRCLVFEIHPTTMRKHGLFEGRIWVEDKDFTIVRFNGIYKGSNLLGSYFHFDSWRVNAGPGLWLPAAIYSEELNLPCCGVWKLNWTKFRFKAQTRFWGYDLKHRGSGKDLARIVVDPSSSIQDRSSSSDALGPFQEKRAWELEGDENVTDKLERVGLLAPPGEVEKALETIANNIEVTNNLSIEPKVQYRVLLTSKLESIVLGHTIIVSRGLLDVLPNETALAEVLAHGLAHVKLGHAADMSYAFADTVMFEPRETFRKMRFYQTKEKEEQARPLAQAWMAKSSYKDSLDSVTRFVVELRRRSFPIYQLLDSDLGDSAYDIFRADLVSKRTLKAPNTPDIRALPLGSRILVDPWTDRTAFLRAEQGEAFSNDQNMPFEVTPMVLYLRRVPESNSAGVSSMGTKN